MIGKRKVAETLRDALQSQGTLSCAPPDNTGQILAVVREALARNPVPDPSVDHLLVRSRDCERWFALAQSITVGAEPGTDLCLDSDYVSGEHCVVERLDDGWLLRDLDSTNKVYVNGRETRQHVLRDGDIIQLANCSLIFIARVASESP